MGLPDRTPPGASPPDRTAPSSGAGRANPAESSAECAGAVTPIEAVIFDMDGLLIDSEPDWRAAEIRCFAEVGLRLEEADCLRTTGLRIDEVVAYWYARHPWAGPSPMAVAERIVDEVIARVRAHGVAKPGVHRALALVRAAKTGPGSPGPRSRPTRVAVGLASSSARRLIDAVIERLGLGGQFDAIHSAEQEAYGKPHPAVYLTMAEKLGVAPGACLAIEDSLNGVLAAKAARMRCLAVLEEASLADPRFVIADAVVDSLEQLDGALYARLGGVVG